MRNFNLGIICSSFFILGLNTNVFASGSERKVEKPATSGSVSEKIDQKVPVREEKGSASESNHQEHDDEHEDHDHLDDSRVGSGTEKKEIKKPKGSGLER